MGSHGGSHGYVSTRYREPARRTRPPMADGELDQHRDTLVALLRLIDGRAREMTERRPFSPEEMRTMLRRHPRAGAGFFSVSQLYAALRRFREPAQLRMTDEEFLAWVPFRPVRTQSGVTPVTVFTRPHPCPGRCIFCPNDVKMPKSYLSDEPGCQRAEDHHFDPYGQTWHRLDAFFRMGHPTDKIELIILGGTWSFYPEAYQRWFVRECFRAMNDFGEPGRSRRDASYRGAADFSRQPRHVDGARLTRTYNQRVVSVLKRRRSVDETASWEALRAVHRDNEHSGARCVGLSVETRPDHLTEAEVVSLRRLGVTKVQVGIQSLDDGVLEANRRGHDVAAVRVSLARLRRAGFKVQAHWMCGLFGSSPEKDKRDFRRLFEDPDFCPDELKVYPCSLVESAELMAFFERGQWSPMAREDLLDVVQSALLHTPRYCRLSRVVRDIPATDIVSGSREGNLREVAERALRARGTPCKDIRSREVRGDPWDPQGLRLRRTHYDTTVARECFLEWVTADDRVVGFLRLSLPKGDPYIGELKGSALIRELHVYGRAVPIGERPSAGAQHRGLGRALLREAESSALASGYGRLSVISAVGTRGYYRRVGFQDGVLYQHRELVKT